jgi:hypothetical protein
MCRWLALGIAVAAAGCGASAREQARREAADFDCRERTISYVATHHMGGDEIGVQMDCAQNGPRIKRWRTDKTGHRIDDVHAVSPSDFDRVWEQVAGVGWENLSDCSDGGGDRDPLYTFDVKDDQNTNSFSCQARSMPYPYNDLVDPLDVLAQKVGGQFVEEPKELQELDDKQPKQ